MDREHITSKLMKAQNYLKVPKNQTNSYGNYKYRSCEDILEAVKPILLEAEMTLTLSDKIVEVGGRVYVEATATLMDIETGATITNTAYAREEETKKGMDASQITGSCSSYARKYALNGLFLIDDTRDADATNTHGKEPEPKQEPKQEPKAAPKVSEKKTVKEQTEEDLNRRVTEGEVERIIKGCEENGVDVAKICRLYNKPKLTDLSAYQFKHIFNNWDRIKRAE